MQSHQSLPICSRNPKTRLNVCGAGCSTVGGVPGDSSAAVGDCQWMEKHTILSTHARLPGEAGTSGIGGAEYAVLETPWWVPGSQANGLNIGQNFTIDTGREPGQDASAQPSSPTTECSLPLGEYGLDKGALLKTRVLGEEHAARHDNGKTSRIRRDIFPLVNDLHSMFMFPWEEQKGSGNKTTKENSMRNDIPMADMPTSWIGIDEFLHVITCQMDVACNLGMPNTVCSCDDVVNEFGEKKCILPKARITHRSKTTKGIMALFCVGVSLPPMDDGSNYDLQTKCNILGFIMTTTRILLDPPAQNSTPRRPEPRIPRNHQGMKSTKNFVVTGTPKNIK
ncbi:hypothetical protein Bbelb_266150 [Branchiostoma belcheri]|nr:hypothetical protein Bbelb_266150 [Branchiostoma belcheri]